MTRKVVVFNMGDNTRQSIDTNATTWGQVLSSSPAIRNMVAEDMKVVIKQTKTTIETEAAILPDHDITIYLTPGKVKSGAKAANFRTIIKAALAPIAKNYLVLAKNDLIQARQMLGTKLPAK